jgi:hypothetical protein
MMLVESDAVIAEPVHFLPGIEMFGIGANRDVGLEVPVRQRVGQLAADLEMIKLFAVGEQIEDENFHGVLPWEFGAPPWWRKFEGQVTARAIAPPIDAEKFHICGIAGCCQSYRGSERPSHSTMAEASNPFAYGPASLFRRPLNSYALRCAGVN